MKYKEIFNIVTEMLFYTTLYWCIFLATDTPTSTGAVSVCAFITYLVRNFSGKLKKWFIFFN